MQQQQQQQREKWSGIQRTNLEVAEDVRRKLEAARRSGWIKRGPKHS